MPDPLIINFAPTGMIPTKATTPHVPVAVSEIVEQVHSACETGITMVHLHARDKASGTPTHKADVYAKIIEGIRAFDRELVICVSLSGRNVHEIEKRAEVLQLEGDAKPDMGSLTLGSMNFAQQASVNAPDTIRSLAEIMRDRGVCPEFEAFDIGMVNYARYLARKALVHPPFYFNLLLGNIATSQANLLHAGMLINDLPDESLWSLAGLGQSQLAANSIAIAMGGGVRTGIEDNMHMDRNRTRLASNTDLLRRIHELAAIHERPVMAASTFRDRMQLKPGHGSYGRNVNSE